MAASKEEALAYLAKIQKTNIKDGGKAPIGYNSDFKPKLENCLEIAIQFKNPVN